jgi:hypothetical protein
VQLIVESQLVKLSRHVFLAVVVYVALDLSLPAMPGAFVFDADNSVESVHSGQGRLTAAVVFAPVDPFTVLVGRMTIERSVRMVAVVERACLLPIGCLARATLSSSTPASLSDPH